MGWTEYPEKIKQKERKTRKEKQEIEQEEQRRPDCRIKRNKREKEHKRNSAVELSDTEPGRSFQTCESHLLRDGAARWTGQKV